MAEIHNEKKKSGMGWLWALLAILAIALIAWWLWPEADMEPVAGLAPVAPIPEPVAVTETPTIATIVANPQSWVGRDFSGVVQVADVPTDRGFWIEQDGQRMFAIVIDQPAEQPVDINAGQQIQIRNATLRDAQYLPQLQGETLTSSTESVVREQPIYLVVNESNLTILNRAAA